MQVLKCTVKGIMTRKSMKETCVNDAHQENGGHGDSMMSLDV